MSTVLVLQHEDCETLGVIDGALRAVGVTPKYIRAYAGDSVPSDIGDARGLIVLGGPMGAYEVSEHPFLGDELKLIARTLHRGEPTLGVCLGAQMMAAALGARVSPGAQKEIGWFPVSLTGEAAQDPLLRGIETEFVALHWHGDVFDLPEGATLLASSALTPNQMFRYGEKSYGIQWHMEMTEEMIEETARGCEDYFRESGIDADAVLGGVCAHLPNLRRIADQAFRRWAELIA